MNETCTKFAIYCEDNGKDSLCVVVDSLEQAQKEKGAHLGKKGRIEESKVQNFGKGGETVLKKKVVDSGEAGGGAGSAVKLSDAQQTVPAVATIAGTQPAMAGGGATAIAMPAVAVKSNEEKMKEFFDFYTKNGSLMLGTSYNFPTTEKKAEEIKAVEPVEDNEIKKDDVKPDFTVEEYVDAIELKHGKDSLKKAKEIIEEKLKVEKSES